MEDDDEMTRDELAAYAANEKLIATAGYRAGIASVLRQLQKLADEIEPAIGDVSGGEAAGAWRQAAMDLLSGRRLPREID